MPLDWGALGWRTSGVGGLVHEMGKGGRGEVSRLSPGKPSGRVARLEEKESF